MTIKRSEFGHPFSTANDILTLAVLKAFDVGDHVPGEEFNLGNDLRYYYSPTSVLAGDDIFVVAPTSGIGRYLLRPGAIDIPFAIAFGTADAAVLGTVPTGCYFRVLGGYWEVTADWTGGTSSAIGISSSQSPHNTKGDLLGGGAGDVAATLVAASVLAEGTIGADVAAGVILRPTATVRFDRITSAFTAGTGFAHLVGFILRNPGV